MKKAILIDAETILRDNGFRATPLRILLLEKLFQSSTPLTVPVIVRKVKTARADTASVYRALNALTEAGVLSAHTLHKDKLSYSFVQGEHGHHIMCTKCKTIESIPFCVRGINTSAVAKSKLFRKISGHTLSFMGTCRKCVRAVR
ncbi:MAG TPA: Fur family transcriptional regulator [Candidatus Paceibacterota bacterium]